MKIVYDGLEIDVREVEVRGSVVDICLGEIMFAAKAEMSEEDFKAAIGGEKSWHTLEMTCEERPEVYKQLHKFRGVRKSGARVEATGDDWRDVFNKLPDWLTGE